MLIDDTQPEETRVVVINGNKLEDVEFETCHRRQIKGNIYLGKVMRVEPSLQACFIDYGGNKHGFMAFGEIHPDYYNLSKEELDAVDKEVDEIIENKKQALKEREAERERIRQEKAAAREQALKAREEKLRLEAEAKAAEEAAETAAPQENETVSAGESVEQENKENKKESRRGRRKSTAAKNAEAKAEEAPSQTDDKAETETTAETAEETSETTNKRHPTKKRLLKKKYRKEHAQEENAEKTDVSDVKEAAEAVSGEPLKVMSESIGTTEESISEEVDEKPASFNAMEDDDVDDDDDDELEMDFELQRKLIRARKLFHRSKIQDVIKEGQILLVQVVKEERGNKGAALTT